MISPDIVTFTLCLYQDLHEDAATRVSQQYSRLLADITLALQQERDRTLAELLVAKETALKQTKSLVRETNALTARVEKLSSACHKMAETKYSNETLCRAKEVAPLVGELRSFQKE